MSGLYVHIGENCLQQCGSVCLYFLLLPTVSSHMLGGLCPLQWFKTWGCPTPLAALN